MWIQFSLSGIPSPSSRDQPQDYILSTFRHINQKRIHANRYVPRAHRGNGSSHELPRRRYFALQISSQKGSKALHEIVSLCIESSPSSSAPISRLMRNSHLRKLKYITSLHARFQSFPKCAQCIEVYHCSLLGEGFRGAISFRRSVNKS